MSTSLLKPCTAWDIVNNWPYGDDSPNQVLDVFVPRDNKGPDGKQWLFNPLITYLHGGGWWTGTEDPDWFPFDAAALIRRGFALASIRYRLSSEAFWPAQICDVLAAHRELYMRAPWWRIYQPKRATMGASAGAQLAGLVAVASDDPTFRRGNWGHSWSGASIVICDYPPTDFRDWVTTPGYTDLQAPDSFVSDLFGAPVLSIPGIADAASPARRVTSNATQMRIRHGTADTTVPYAQSQKLQAGYVAAGLTSKVTLTPIAGAGHGTPSSAFYSAALMTELGNRIDEVVRP